MGIHNTGSAVKKPQLIRNDKSIDCNISNYVPFVVPGLSTSSSTTPTPTSLSSSSQDSVFDVDRYTEKPGPERSGSRIEEQQRNPETENNKKKWRGSTKRFLHELPDWLQEFKEKLVDERTSRVIVLQVRKGMQV